MKQNEIAMVKKCLDSLEVRLEPSTFERLVKRKTGDWLPWEALTDLRHIPPDCQPGQRRRACHLPLP